MKNRHLKSLMLYFTNIELFSEKVKGFESDSIKMKKYLTGALSTLYDQIYQSYAILNIVIIKY